MVTFSSIIEAFEEEADVPDRSLESQSKLKLPIEHTKALPPQLQDDAVRKAWGKEILEELRLILGQDNPPQELPKTGVLAGGCVANLIANRLLGTNAPVRDVDHFVRVDYNGRNKQPIEEQYYQIENVREQGKLSTITYSVNPIAFQSQIETLLNSFDLNCTKAGIDCATGELFIHKDFSEFIAKREITITKYMRLARTLGRFWDKVEAFGLNQTPEQYAHNKEVMFRCALEFKLRCLKRARETEPDGPLPATPSYTFDLSEKSAKKAQLINKYVSDLLEIRDNTPGNYTLISKPIPKMDIEGNLPPTDKCPKTAEQIQYILDYQANPAEHIRYVEDTNGIVRDDKIQNALLIDTAIICCDTFQEDSIAAKFACEADLARLLLLTKRHIHPQYINLLREQGVSKEAIQNMALAVPNGLARLPEEYAKVVGTTLAPPEPLREYGKGTKRGFSFQTRSTNPPRYTPDRWTLLHTAATNGTLPEISQGTEYIDALKAEAEVNSATHNKKVAPLYLALAKSPHRLPSDLIANQDLINDEVLVKAAEATNQAIRIPASRWTAELIDRDYNRFGKLGGPPEKFASYIVDHTEITPPANVAHLYPQFKTLIDERITQREESMQRCENVCVTTNAATDQTIRERVLQKQQQDYERLIKWARDCASLYIQKQIRQQNKTKHAP